MRQRTRLISAAVLAVVALLVLSACGSDKNKGGSVTVLMGTAPDFLDPAMGYTTQAAEPDWISYTPLLTYAHEEGEAGTKLIPGLAEALPQISSDGKTYTFTLRKGLVYSDGKPVKASDFAYSIQRMIKLNWGGKSFFTSYVDGAEAYDKGSAKSISGIVTDDATGKITIKLSEAYGAFPNVVAFPAAAVLPTGTPVKNLSAKPPPGVGPYKITKVIPNRTFTLEKNPKFPDIPGIPKGHLTKITVKINTNTQTEAQQVLNNQADAFDAGDTVPPSLVAQIKAKAADRFEPKTVPSTFYFFLNTRLAPFNNIKARQAVNYALDRRALQRLASGFLEPGCFFLPEGIVGHPTSPCPSGDPNQPPNLAKAKELVQQSGQAGTKITVWGETRSPRKEYVNYYASVLNKIGFKATPKIIADATYFATIGNEKTKAQTGFADWIQDFPNPIDFYLLMSADAIQPVNNENFSNVDDPHIESELKALQAVPTTKLDTVADRWKALDEYVAKQSYQAVYGAEQVPKFFSDRLDFDAAKFHPLYFNDWTTWQLK
jgi:peptide/nickel transport system substrate-binding protein